MCEDCTNFRERVKTDLMGALAGTPNALTEKIDESVPAAVEAVTARIDEAISEGRVPEEHRPSEEEIRSAVRDCLLGAVLATGAAALAQHTPGYTDEGKRPASVILGTWAGCIFQSEMDDADAAAEDLLRYLLGMGDN